MSKRGPLSKAETFYIENHMNEQGVESLAKELDRSISSVEKYIKKISKDKTTTFGKVGGQFARSHGAVVMTENASSMSDSKRKIGTKNNTNCVVKIKHD
jgi:hypothetical protein